MRWAICAGLLAAVSTSALTQAQTQSQPGTKLPPLPTQQALQQSSPQPVQQRGQVAQPTPPAPQGMLADVARVVGMTKCRPVLERLSPMIARESLRQDVLVDRNPAVPGEGPVFLLMGMQSPAGSAALSISAVPEEDGSCSFAAERISMAPFTCDSVAKAELPGYRVTRLLENFTVYTDPNDPAANVSMIDAAPGCIVIRRHVQFRWKPGAPTQAPPLPAQSPASRSTPQPAPTPSR